MTVRDLEQGQGKWFRGHGARSDQVNETQGARQSLHIHMISDSGDQTLTAITNNVRNQYKEVDVIEHEHVIVRSRRQLAEVMKHVEAARGIVIYSLKDKALSEALEQSCEDLNLRCLAAPISQSAKQKSSFGQEWKSSRWSRGVLLLIGGFLAWAVITRSLGAYWAEIDPELAVLVPARSPTALVNVAAASLEETRDRIWEDNASDQGEATSMDRRDRAFIQDPDAGDGVSQKRMMQPVSDASTDLAKARSWLEEALRKDPLNGRALGLLGEIAYTARDEVRTDRFFQAAAQHSLHESRALYWVMRRQYDVGKYLTALRYADVLLRTRPGMVKDVMPILGRLAEDKNAKEGLEEILASNPSWRREFFGRVLPHITDARTPLKLMLSLKESPNPPTSADLSTYVNFLTKKGFYDLAYYTWLQFLPPDELGKVGRLYNGGFESSPSGLPFDWKFTAGPNVSITVATRPDGDAGRALLLDFGLGRVSSLGVEQLVALPPGGYEFLGSHNADVVSQGDLLWRVTCAGKKNTMLGESLRVGQSTERGWQDFSFSFEVPQEGCPAQRVQLVFSARSASERFVSGSVWYDDLKIEREDSQ